jgi:flagella basal body P-ring formation protein FlgA
MFKIIFAAALVIFASDAAATVTIQTLASIERAVAVFVEIGIDQRDDVEFTIGRLDPRLRLPLCNEALQTRSTHVQRNSGPMSVEVRCTGTKPWVLYVPVTLTRYAQATVAVRPIARNAVIAAADIALQRRRVSANARDYLSDTTMAVGQIAVRPVVTGQMLTARALRRPHLIRRGDRVVLSAGNPSIAVRVKGEALQDGVAGDRINVRNLSSERVIQGVVTSAGEVVVANSAML